MNIYDKLLAAIGIGLLIAIIFLWTIPIAGFIASAATIVLMGVAMFVFSPEDTPYPPQMY